MGMALMLVPRDLRLSRSKAAHHKTPIIPRRFRPSRRRNRFTLKKYKIDRRLLAEQSLAIAQCRADVRFTPNSGHYATNRSLVYSASALF
jgi:hypothetical protein